MLWRLLKNDITHAKLPNFVMVLFILISTMLACTSVSLLYSVQNQITYFMNDMGNVADYNFSMMNISQNDLEKVDTFIDEQGLKNVQLAHGVNLPLTSFHFPGYEALETSGCFAATLPETYNLVFDEQNEIPDIKQGEVGIPISFHQQLGIELGDQLEITRGEEVYTYKISSFIRDSLYGSDMMGQKRILFHPEDYLIQEQVTNAEDHMLIMSLNQADAIEQLEYEMQAAGLPGYIAVDKETAKLSFMGVGLGTSALLMMSGVILLCMSFLMIRFTILFQIEQNYSEIGIMKAIGLRHAQIRPLYTSKYIVFTLIGGISGFLVSIPLTGYLERMQNYVIPALPGSIGTMLSSIVILLIVLLVYIITVLVLHRLKKQSTMDAIRKGYEGASYQPLSKISLAHFKHLSLPVFLAINDLIIYMKNTIMMIAIYTFCMLLILIPTTLKDSFQNDAFLQILNLSVADLYTQQDGGTTIAALTAKKAELLEDLKEYDPEVRIELETMSSAAISEAGVNTAGFLLKRANGTETVEYIAGVAPFLENEIALSEKLAKKYDKTIGDTITVLAEGEATEYLITGTYASMMNLGNNMLVHDTNCNYAYTGYLAITFSGTDYERSTLRDQVMSDYQGMTLVDSYTMMKSFSGDMATQVATMANLIIFIMVLLAGALTILFAKLHMLKMRHAIALMQSLGSSRRELQRWQLMRSMIMIGCALVLGVLLHTMFTAELFKLYFVQIGMGGIKFVIDPVHTYVVYPFVFFVTVSMAQLLVNKTIPKWDVASLREE